MCHQVPGGRRAGCRAGFGVIEPGDGFAGMGFARCDDLLDLVTLEGSSNATKLRVNMVALLP